MMRRDGGETPRTGREGGGETPRTDREGGETPRTGREGGETPRSAREAARSPRPDWFKAKASARAEGASDGQARKPPVVAYEPGALSTRLFRSDLRGAAKMIQAVHDGVATRIMFSPSYDGGQVYSQLPPKTAPVVRTPETEAAGLFVASADEIGRNDRAAPPRRKAAVEPWVQSSGNIIAGGTGTHTYVVREKPSDSLGRATADAVRAAHRLEALSLHKPTSAWALDTSDNLIYGHDVDHTRGEPRRHPTDAAGRRSADLARADHAESGRVASRAGVSAWVADSADDVLYSRDLDQTSGPPRTHDADSAGKSSATFDAADDYLDNVGARHANAQRHNSAWVKDTADDAIYGEDRDRVGSPRRHAPDAAGKTSLGVGAESLKAELLLVSKLATSELGRGGAHRATINTAWKYDVADDWMYARDLDYQSKPRDSHGFAGVSSTRKDQHFARESLLEGAPVRRVGQHWNNDTSDELIFNRDINFQPPARAPDPGTAGVRSAVVEAEALRFEHPEPRKRTNESWLPDTADDLIYSRDLDHQIVPPRRHDADSAGVSSAAFDAADDYLDNVGARHANAQRHNSAWVEDTADDAIYGEDRDRVGSPRRHAPNAAGKASAKAGLAAQTELGFGPARARSSAWVSDGVIIGARMPSAADAQPPRLRAPTAGMAAGKSSVHLAAEELGRELAEPGRRKPNAAFVPDTADEVIFGHDIDAAQPARLMGKSVAGKASLRVGEDDRRRSHLKERAAQSTWVEESAGDIIFGQKVAARRASPVRQHSRGVAGKSTRAAQSAPDAQAVRSDNLVWLYTNSPRH